MSRPQGKTYLKGTTSTTSCAQDHASRQSDESAEVGSEGKLEQTKLSSLVVSTDEIGESY